MTFQASFVFTPESMTALQRAYSEKNWPLNPTRSFQLLCMFLAVSAVINVGLLLMVPDLLWKSWGWNDVAWQAASWLLFAAVLYSVHLLHLRTVTPQRCSIDGQRLDITVNEHGLTYRRDDSGHGFLPWNAIEAVSTTKDGNYSVAWCSPREGMLFPKTAFGSPEAFQQATDYMKGKVGEARK